MVIGIQQYALDLWGSVRKRGLVSTLKLLLPEVWFDLRYGTDTFRLIRIEELTDVDSQNKAFAGGYQGANALLFKKAFTPIRRDFSREVFIDFGSGKGRALLLAANLGFRKVVGVEFSPALVEVARRNVEIFQRRSRNRVPIDVVCSDAAAYPIDDEASVFFFFNPFREKVMGIVLDNILASLKRKPREAHFVYLNPMHPEVFAEKGLQKIFSVSSVPNHEDAIVYLWTPGRER